VPSEELCMVNDYFVPYTLHLPTLSMNQVREYHYNMGHYWSLWEVELNLFTVITGVRIAKIQKCSECYHYLGKKVVTYFVIIVVWTKMRS